MQYRKEIDGLRTVAVLPVILFHAGFSWFSGGYIGVDVFFVISGYLITSILINDLDSGRFSIANFYERRARRILPALFFVMLCCIPFAYAWMIPQQFKDFSQAFVAVSFFSSNIFFFMKEDYFAPAAEESPLLHTWSLAVEEQFYIFFPILLLALWRFGKQPIFYVVIGLSCVSLLLSEWGWRNYPSANFYLLPTRAWELGVGAICALYTHKRSVNQSQSLSMIGIALIFYSIIFFNESTPFPSIYTIVPVLGAALIILFCSTKTVVYKLLSLKYVVWIGLISYSAYLWHQPLMAFARIKIYPHPGWVVMLTLFFASLGLAYLTWRYIERPFRTKDGSWINSRVKVFSTAALASFALISFGIYGHVNDGVPERIPLSEAQRSYLSTAIASPMRNKCHADDSHVIAPGDACRYNNENATIAVFGDSHVVELAYALGEKLKSSGVGVAHFSFSSCGVPYLREDNLPCVDWAEETIDYIVDSKEFTHVVVSYRMTTKIWSSPQNLYPDLPPMKNREHVELVDDSLHSLLTKIADSGKKVIFVEQSPELPRKIQTLVYSASLTGGNLPGFPTAWWNTFDTFAEDTLDIPAFVSQVNASELFCDDDICYAGKDGVSFYFDNNHLSVDGAMKVADLIIKETDILVEE